MARGPKKHLKRLKAPKHWMLDKLSGVFAPRPSTGPHKMRESLPLMILLRNRLKYALTKRECQTILMNRLIKVRPSGQAFAPQAPQGGGNGGAGAGPSAKGGATRTRAPSPPPPLPWGLAPHLALLLPVRRSPLTACAVAG